MNEPVTTGEMVERLSACGWNKAMVFKAVQTLSEQGCLKVAGLEKCAKSYARKFVPALTKAEYYAEAMMKRGLDSSSIPNITAAFLSVADKGDTERDAEVIAKLEEIIDTLRKTVYGWRNPDSGRGTEEHSALWLSFRLFGRDGSISTVFD